ncbi:MAG TPA: hypothetical protein VF103_18595, partial [Polyangiaceae bacterium]
GALAGDARSETLDAFTLSADTYASSSGSAVLDGDGRLVGVMTRGQTDFVERGGCRASRVLDDDAAGETANYAFRAVETLCAADFPSPALCGIEPACGDGTCSPGEDSSSCEDDCEPPACGDFLCETSEWESCPDDCGDRRPPGIPNDWFCRSEWYADGETCDCECGARDPDCSGPCESIGPSGRSPDAAPARRAPDGGCSIALYTDSRQTAREALVTATLVLAALVAGLLRSRRRSSASRNRDRYR